MGYLLGYIVDLVVARSLNHCIGRDGDIPWSNPEDMKHFRELTWDSIVIMGRKTFDSFGNPLKRRINIVLSRIAGPSQIYFHDINTSTIFTTLEELDGLLAILADKKIYVIGGESIYKQLMHKINAIHLSEIPMEVDGDRFFDFDEGLFYEPYLGIPYQEYKTFNYRYLVRKPIES